MNLNAETQRSLRILILLAVLILLGLVSWYFLPLASDKHAVALTFMTSVQNEDVETAFSLMVDSKQEIYGDPEAFNREFFHLHPRPVEWQILTSPRSIQDLSANEILVDEEYYARYQGVLIGEYGEYYKFSIYLDRESFESQAPQQILEFASINIDKEEWDVMVASRAEGVSTWFESD